MATSSGDDVADAEFAGVNMHGARFRMVDLRTASFRQVDLSGSRMRGVYLVGAEIDGEFDGLQLCGVEVAPLIEAELDRRHPERAVLRATTRAGIEAMWASTVERVASMPDGTIDVSVDGEWSFIQTLRHLLLATDAWLGKAIFERDKPFHPLGLLFTEYAGREADYGLDAAATPSYAEVLEARAGRMGMVRDYVARVTPEDLAMPRADPWGSEWQPTVLDCVRIICLEEWNHHRYAVRDLATIDA